MGGTTVHHLTHGEHLIDDFMGLQRALQTLLSGGAETAGHRAPHLAADADRESITGGDAHGFQRETVVCGQQQFGRAIAGHTSMQLSGAPQGGWFLIP